MESRQIRPTRLGNGVDRKQKYFKPLNLTKKNYQQSTIPQIKSWAVDLLGERFFQGADSPQHRHAVRFWMRSGGRLRGV